MRRGGVLLSQLEGLVGMEGVEGHLKSYRRGGETESTWPSHFGCEERAVSCEL